MLLVVAATLEHPFAAMQQGYKDMRETRGSLRLQTFHQCPRAELLLDWLNKPPRRQGRRLAPWDPMGYEFSNDQHKRNSAPCPLSPAVESVISQACLSSLASFHVCQL